VPDLACKSCFQVMTDDPSGMCEDCQEGAESQRPATITETQRQAILAGMHDVGIRWDVSGHRGAFIRQVIPRWDHGGNLNALSQAQAGDLLEALEARRRRGDN